MNPAHRLVSHISDAMRPPHPQKNPYVLRDEEYFQLCEIS